MGGKTYLTAEAALMLDPPRDQAARTRIDFIRMCRLYGMTMADVRMDEAWAMAVWLNRDANVGFDIAGDDEPCVVLRWHDNALTQRRPDDLHPNGAEVLADGARSSQLLTFISRTTAAPQVYRLHRMKLSYLPFSHYDLGERAANALAVLAHRPKADDVGNLIALPVLPPRERELITWQIHDDADVYVAEYRPVGGRAVRTIEPSSSRLERKIGDKDADVIQLVQA